MFYLKKRIAQVMTMSIMLTNMTVQATTTQNVLNENYAVNMYKSTTSGGLQITTPPSIELKPVTYIGENYEVTFRVQSKWDGKFNGEFIIKNTGESDIENWALELDFDHNITQIWNARIKEHDGNSYVLKNLGYNQDIKAGESVAIGFQAEWKDSIKAPEKYELLGTKTEASDEKYDIDFKVTSDWGSAFNGEISITNNGEETIEDWTLEFDFDKNIERFWTAEILEHEGDHYVIKNAGYNANIEPGQTLRLGFGGNPGIVETKPENYVLNQVVEEEEIDYEKDSDGDGLPDWFEEELGTDSNNEDSDGDGLPDGYEYLNLRTDPLKTDTDENGISDAKEDLDEDLLNNEDEYKLNTSPVHCDTDLDGLTDYEEYSVYKTNPLVYDTDNDGLGDGEEIPYNLDPTKQSTYDDGIIDGDRTFEEKIESQQEGTSIKANIIIEGTINEINNSAINMIADDGIYLSKDVPGYIGNAYEFKLDEDIKEATIRFEIDENIWSNSEVIPAIYHWDEDKQLLEKVNMSESQTSSRISARNGYLQTKIYKSGIYMVLDSKVWDAIWDIELLDNFSQTIGKPGMKIVFSLDESGSMSWNDPSRLRYKATHDFIDVLGEKDEAAIVKFSGYGRLVQGFTKDKDLLKAAVGNYRQSKTAIYRGFEVALDQFDDNKGRQRYLFLLTDGEGSYTNQADIIAEAKQKGVVIYTIGLGDDPDSDRLSEIARETGGRYIGVDNASELESVFAGVSGEIIDYGKDTDEDGLNDYYEKKINIGELRLGDGSKIGKIKYDDKDSDYDALLDGEELKVISYATQLSEGKFKTLVYAKMDSSPVKLDTDGDGYLDNIDPDPLYWNVSHRDLAMFASMSYSYLPIIDEIDNLSEELKLEINKRFGETADVSELKSWSIIDTWYAKGGLQIIAFKNGDNIVIAHRGTNDGLDWFNNATTYVLGLSTQSPAAKKFIKSVMENYPECKYYITGHSLGGHLTYNAAAEAINKDIDKVEEIVTFNGLGLVAGVTLVGDLWDDKQLLKKKNDITSYSVEGDLVSTGLLDVTTMHYGTIIRIPKTDKVGEGKLARHDMKNFLDVLKLFGNRN